MSEPPGKPKHLIKLLNSLDIFWGGGERGEIVNMLEGNANVLEEWESPTPKSQLLQT